MSLPLDEVGRYEIRRPDRSDLARLRSFAADIWGIENADKFDDRWWWRDTEPHCWVAVDSTSADVAAICGARRSQIHLGGSTYSAVSICDWYVSPHHRGKGLGRALVQRGGEDAEVLYTSSISESAAVGFSRMGWIGDKRFPLGLSPTLATAAVRKIGRGSDITVDDVSLGSDGRLNEQMRDVVDAMWHRSKEHRNGMVRDADQLVHHLRLAGVALGRTQYSMLVAQQKGEAVGYLLYRVTPRGAISSLPGMSLVLISDFLTNPNSPEVLRALLTEVSRQTTRRAPLMVATASHPADLKVLHRCGFVTAGTPLIGRPLAYRMSSRTMFRPGTNGPSPETQLHLTLADNDTDLILRANPA